MICHFCCFPRLCIYNTCRTSDGSAGACLEHGWVYGMLGRSDPDCCVTVSVIVMNPAHGLPLTHHQRSLAHHMTHNTHCCAPPQTAIPITHCTDDTRTKHTADCTDHTTYLNHGLTLPLGRVLFSI